ncbi:MAG: hypothetical protein NVSMB6_11120 [Burkholderiaceae bacterium]
MRGPDSDKRWPRFDALIPPADQPIRQLAMNGAGIAPPPSAGSKLHAEAAPEVQLADAQTAAKPLQNAIAITYKTSAGAPRVVAKGRGAVAEQIIACAREHGVFVHESKELVALLMQVELDDHIPPALYRAVAELLAWLYKIEAAGLDGGKVSC